MKKGDKVEIVGNTIVFSKEGKLPPYLGTIVSVDGEYVMVKPKYQRWVGQWYRNELKVKL